MDMFKKSLKKAQVKASEIAFEKPKDTNQAQPTVDQTPPTEVKSNDVHISEPTKDASAVVDHNGVEISNAPIEGPPSPSLRTPMEELDVKETMGNGTLVCKHKTDGHKVMKYPDNTEHHQYHDGSTKTIRPDGTVTHYTPTVTKEDYLDKAFKKGAGVMGIHLSRETSEKITDKGRKFFEQKSGKKLNAKFSN